MESVLVDLSREKCLRLMATALVGRIIYTRRAMPAVELVNFTLDAGDIVIRTSVSGKLAAAIRGARGRRVRPGYPHRLVGDRCRAGPRGLHPAMIERLRVAGPHPWAPGEHPYFMRITPGTVNGRYLTSAGTGPAGPQEELPPPPAR
jgi:hypothetical protein